MTIPRRGEVWYVVPITGWQPKFAGYPWFSKLSAAKTNGLSKTSGADSFQIRSVSRERFVRKIGRLTAAQVQELTYRVALCIGMDPDGEEPTVQ